MIRQDFDSEGNDLNLLRYNMFQFSISDQYVTYGTLGLPRMMTILKVSEVTGK